MSAGRTSAHNPFDGLLAAVKRPTAPASQASPLGAEPAAEAFQASAAFFSEMTESCPIAARSGQGMAAPAGAPAAAGAAVLTVALSPAVALILSLVTSAKGVSADEAVSRAICVFAETIGIPSLARKIGEARQIGAGDGKRHGNSEPADFHAVPDWRRSAATRFPREGRFPKEDRFPGNGRFPRGDKR